MLSSNQAHFSHFLLYERNVCDARVYIWWTDECVYDVLCVYRYVSSVMYICVCFVRLNGSNSD